MTAAPAWPARHGRRRPLPALVVLALHAALGWALLDGVTAAAQRGSVGQRIEALIHVRLLPLPSAVSASPPKPEHIAPPARSAPPVHVGRAAQVARETPTRPAAPLVPIALPSPTPVPQALEPAAATVSPARGTDGPPAAALRAGAGPTGSGPAESETPVTIQAAAPPALQQARPDHRHCPDAAYPALLRERGIEGVVRVQVRVSPEGRAAEARVVAGSGWRLFDEAAVQRALACRFIPARRGDDAVEGWVDFPVRFALVG